MTYHRRRQQSYIKKCHIKYNIMLSKPLSMCEAQRLTGYIICSHHKGVIFYVVALDWDRLLFSPQIYRNFSGGSHGPGGDLKPWGGGKESWVHQTPEFGLGFVLNCSFEVISSDCKTVGNSVRLLGLTMLTTELRAHRHSAFINHQVLHTTTQVTGDDLI